MPDPVNNATRESLAEHAKIKALRQQRNENHRKGLKEAREKREQQAK